MEPKHFREWLAAPAGKREPLVMGILNMTPDSFSDGGTLANAEDALSSALDMAGAGADVIDIGGESTRPGALPVEPAEQIRRVVPVIRAVRQAGVPVTLSIDTTRATVARAAIDAGVDLVNDISAGRDDAALLPLVAERRIPVVLMHMQGTPATMQLNPTYSDVTTEIIAFLRQRLEAAMRTGIPEGSILLDPGIGFGKNAQHNLQVLRDTSKIAAALAPHPILLGSSRKGFIGTITGEADPAGRQFGTAATVAWAVANGAAMVRVHDVRAMVQVVRMVRAINEPRA